MKKIFLLSGILFLGNLGYSQSKTITILGTMPQANGGDHISFAKPIGKYATSRYYVSNTDNAVIKNDTFIKILNFPTLGMVTLYEKPYNFISSARFFAEPGDTIKIIRQNGDLIFKGKNAIVNKMYSEKKISPVGFSNIVFDIYKKNSDSNKIIESINDKQKEYLKYYNDLFLKNEISKSCLEYTQIMTEQSIDYMGLMFAESAKDPIYRKEQNLKITEKEINKLIDYFNLKYIPYKSENLKSIIFEILIKKNALYLENQALNKECEITRFWNQFDNMFESSSPNFGVIDYIESDEYKELYLGSNFFNLINSDEYDSSKNYKDLILFYKKFAEKFPNSPYLLPISESIMNLAASINLSTNNTKTDSNIPLGSLAVYDTILEPVSTSLFAHPNQSFIDAIIEKFPNQDLFIDFWATFCSPCIKQFEYNNGLHSFLDAKNVKTLYISVDEENNKLKWEKYIQDYNLTGYHFLAEDVYSEKHLKPLAQTIPSYYIYNSKIKKIILVNGYPSEKEKFYNQINIALKSSN